jgi:nucleoside-diphosphate-sugar epimerase
MLPKITIIGGAGFVGTNFCQKLADQQIPFEIIDLKLSQRFPKQEIFYT